MNAPVVPNLERARRRLRVFQRRWDSSAGEVDTPITDAALAWLRSWPAATDAADGGDVRDAVRARPERTSAIIERIAPGSSEDLGVITTLAWQAATFELLLVGSADWSGTGAVGADLAVARNDPGATVACAHELGVWVSAC